MALCLVLVLAIEVFNLHVLVEGVVHVFTPPHQKLQVCVHFLPGRLEVHIHTLHKVVHAALEKLANGAFHFCPLQEVELCTMSFAKEFTSASHPSRVCICPLFCCLIMRPLKEATNVRKQSINASTNVYSTGLACRFSRFEHNILEL